MTTETLQQLRPTSWLAKRLGLSLATIERLRSQNSPDLPPHVTIGRSIRYDEAIVEKWLHQRMQPDAPSIGLAGVTHRRIWP